MLALEIVAIVLLTSLGILFFRHLRLVLGKDSNNPIQRTSKLASKRKGDRGNRSAGDLGYSTELLDGLLEEAGSPLMEEDGGHHPTAKEKRERLFQSKQDIRRAIIIDELLRRYDT